MQMASKHIERCFMSSVFREFQIKTISYHYTPVRMAKFCSTDNTNAEHKDLSFIAGGQSLEDDLAVSYDIKHTLIYFLKQGFAV